MVTEPNHSELDRGARPRAGDTDRLCVSTRQIKPIEEMIRFVVAPDGSAVADLKRRLPGRGVWVTATRSALEYAVKCNCFARSFKRQVRLAPDFVDATERLLARAALDALAIAGQAGRVITGFTKVEAALAASPVVALIHASDASREGVRKLDAAIGQRFGNEGPPFAIVTTFTSAQLDLALARSNVVHAAVLAGPASETFLVRLRRLERFRTDGTDVPGRDDLHGE